jgi:hypothetical protein
MRIGSHRFGARGNPTPRAIQRTLTNNGLARCSHGRYTSHAPRHRSHSVFRERLHVGGWFAFVALTVGAALIAVSAIELLARRMDRSRRHARRALNVCCYCVHSDSKRLIRRHCAVMVTARGRTEPGHDASGQRCCRNCERTGADNSENVLELHKVKKTGGSCSNTVITLTRCYRALDLTVGRHFHPGALDRSSREIRHRGLS